MAIPPPSPTNALVVCIALPCICILTVALRLISKRKSGASLAIEDRLVILSLFFTIAMGIAVVVGVKRGTIGYATPSRRDPNRAAHIKLATKLEWIVQLLSIPQIGFVKLSFAFFFRRIFGTTKSSTFRWFNNLLILIIILWTLAFFSTTFFACKGKFADWWAKDRGGRAVCISQPMFLEALSISDFVIDVGVIVMPILMVWGLKMSRTKKFLISGVFLLGSLAVTASIIRLVIYYQIKDASTKPPGLDTVLTNTQLVYWSTIISSLGLIAACLPSLYGLIRRSSFDSVVRSFRSVISLVPLRLNGSQKSRELVSETDGNEFGKAVRN